MKNATCVLPQPGKHIANVLHCVNKLLQVFTISFIFLSFNCYGLRLERTAQVVEAHAMCPAQEREREHQGAVVSQMEHGMWTSKASQGMFMMGECAVLLLARSVWVELWVEVVRRMEQKTNPRAFYKPPSLLSHKNPLQKPWSFSATYHLVSYSVSKGAQKTSDPRHVKSKVFHDHMAPVVQACDCTINAQMESFHGEDGYLIKLRYVCVHTIASHITLLSVMDMIRCYSWVGYLEQCPGRSI